MDSQRRYYFPVTGYNFRITNVACAMLCAQLERYEQILDRRQQIFSEYSRQLEGIQGIEFQPVSPCVKPAQWLFCITVNEKEYGRSRDELMTLLTKKGIETRPFFLALHRLPPFRKESTHRGEKLPVTDRLSMSGINLPTYASITKHDIENIAKVISCGAR